MGEEPLELRAQTTPSLSWKDKRPPCPQRLPIVGAAEVPGDPRLVSQQPSPWGCGLQCQVSCVVFLGVECRHW